MDSGEDGDLPNGFNSLVGVHSKENPNDKINQDFNETTEANETTEDFIDTLDLDEEDKETIASLDKQEKKIVNLLESNKQFLSLKERYESKIYQISLELESLTVHFVFL